jgi:hypothetical protein
MVAWSRDGEVKKLSLPGETMSATMVDMVGRTRALAFRGEGFPVELPAATLNDAPPGSPPDYIVGGEPVIIVEQNVAYREGTVAGVVRDTAGRPLANHPVHVGPTAATTDANGRFAVTLPPGLYDVTLGDRIGWAPVSQAYAVPVRGGATVERTLIAKELHLIRAPIVAKRYTAR